MMEQESRQFLEEVKKARIYLMDEVKREAV